LSESSPATASESGTEFGRWGFLKAPRRVTPVQPAAFSMATRRRGFFFPATWGSRWQFPANERPLRTHIAGIVSLGPVLAFSRDTIARRSSMKKLIIAVLAVAGAFTTAPAFAQSQGSNQAADYSLSWNAAHGSYGGFGQAYARYGFGNFSHRRHRR
jgi:hypothetical protein